MVQPMVKQDFKNVATKSNQIKSNQFKPNQDKSIQNSSKEEWEQSLEIVSWENEIEKKEEYWNKEINDM